jgi:hypothetical protein
MENSGRSELRSRRACLFRGTGPGGHSQVRSWRKHCPFPRQGCDPWRRHQLPEFFGVEDFLREVSFSITALGTPRRTRPGNVISRCSARSQSDSSDSQEVGVPVRPRPPQGLPGHWRNGWPAVILVWQSTWLQGFLELFRALAACHLEKGPCAGTNPWWSLRCSLNASSCSWARSRR